METTRTDPIPSDPIAAQPYPPSFIDRFMRFVQRLPVPYWLTYLALFIVQSLFNHVVAWADGWLPRYTFSALNIIYPLWTWLPLLMMTYLNGASLRALSKFQPLLELSPESSERLRHEFVTLPARQVLISECIWAGMYVLWTVRAYSTYRSNGFGTLAILDSILGGAGVFLVGSIIIFHTIRQLRLVNRTVRTVKRFDVFRLQPVYSFSVFTSQSGLAWILLTILTLLATPVQLAPPLVLFVLLEGTVLALAAFVLPLWVVHQRLVAEKNELLAERDQRVKSMLAKLHRALDEDRLEDASQIRGALDGLSAESGILEKVRTWPWSTGTLTGFLSAIVLPMVLYFVQRAIQKWLGG